MPCRSVAKSEDDFFSDMNFSRNQLIGALILLIVIWMVILYRMLFSAA